MAANKAQKIREEAIKLFSKGKWDKALEEYSKLAKLEPEDPKLFQKMAELQIRLDMKKQAIDTYKKAVELFMARGFLIQAIAIAKVVIQMAPEEKDMEEKLTQLYAKRGMGPMPGTKPAPPPPPRREPQQPQRPQPEAAKPASETPPPSPTSPPPRPPIDASKLRPFTTSFIKPQAQTGGRPSEAAPKPQAGPAAQKPPVAGVKPQPSPIFSPPKKEDEAIALDSPEDSGEGMIFESTSVTQTQKEPASEKSSEKALELDESEMQSEIQLDDGIEEESAPAIISKDGIKIEEGVSDKIDFEDAGSNQVTSTAPIKGGIEIEADSKMELTDSGPEMPGTPPPKGDVVMEAESGKMEIEGAGEEIVEAAKSAPPSSGEGIELDVGIDSWGESPAETKKPEETAKTEKPADKVWDLSEGLDSEADEAGIDIDVMGDLNGQVEERAEEEKPAEKKEPAEEAVAEKKLPPKKAVSPVLDLSREMESEQSAGALLDEWDDEEAPAVEEAPAPANDSLFDDSEIEAANFFPEIPLFSDLSQDEFREVVHKLRSKSYSKGDVIIREGDQGDSILIVGSGSVEVFKETEEGNKIMLAVLKEGDFFGEFGYFAGSKRQASVLASEDTDLLEITRDDMEDAVRKFPGVEQVLEKFYRTRVVENILATSYLFMDFAANQRSKIASKFKFEEVRENENIVAESEEGSKMYLIRSGSVEVHTTNPMGDKILLADLGPGDFFGEISLLTGKPRTATVTAATPIVELMALNKEDMDELISVFPAIGEKLNEALQARTEDTINKVSILDLDDVDLEIGSLL